MKPKILVSISENAESHYSNAILNCGGIPFCKYLPHEKNFYDGLILAGGGDIDPSFFGEKNCGSNPPDKLRDECEFELFRKYFKENIPIFGICRGHQIINVFLGGTLIQDISDKKNHAAKNGADNIHKTEITGGILKELYGNFLITNSSHHQAIGKTGADIIPTQFCENIIEGSEHKSGRIFSVQWHPERMMLSFKNDFRNSDSSKIFKYFLSMCKS